MFDFISRLLETRKGTAIYCILGSVIVSFITGGLLLGIPIWLMQVLIFKENRELMQSIILTSKFIFFLGGIPLMICGVLHLLTSMDDDWCFRFGFILYYGTLLIKRFISGMVHGSDFSLYLISFVITVLLSYFIYSIGKNDNRY